MSQNELKTATTPSEILKQGMRHWMTGVALATTSNDSAQASGIIINSLSSVSLEPPLVLFTLDKKSAVYADFITIDKKININILASDQQHVVDNFIKKPFQHRWEGIEAKGNVPILENALTIMECKVFDLIDRGDHTIVLVQVEHSLINHEKSPLIYYDRNFLSLK